MTTKRFRAKILALPVPKKFFFCFFVGIQNMEASSEI